MAKLPTSINLSGPASLRSGRVIASYDTSAVGRGLSNLGASLESVAAERQQQNDALDITRAEAYKTQGLLNVQNEFDADPDYSTYDKRAPARTGEIVTKAADLIRNPKTRERWLAGAQGDAARINDGIFDKGTQTQKNAEIIAFDDALEVNRRLYVDPDTPEEVKAKARKDIEASISMAQQVGLLDPVTAEARRKAYIEDAEFSRGKLAVERDPSIIPGSRGEVARIIADAANRYGVPEDLAIGIATIESGLNPNAKAATSSASGLFQFIDSTGKRYGLKNKLDAGENADAGARLTRDNINGLRKATGREPTPGEVYLAHFSGFGAAMKLASAPPETPTSEIFSPQAIRANASILSGKTAGQVREWADRKMAKAMGAPTQAPEWYSRLSPEQRAAIDHQAAARQQQLQTAADAQLKAAQVTRDGDYRLRIATQDVSLTPQEILADPVLDSGGKASLINAWESKNKEGIETARAIADFSQNKLTVDYYDPKGQGLIDRMYTELSKNLPPEAIQPLAEEALRQSGVVAQPFLNTIRGGIEGTDAQGVMEALQAAQRLSLINPAALARRTGGADVQSAADDFSFYVDRLNMSPEDAAKHIMAMNDPQQVRDRKALEPAAKAFTKEMESFDIANSFDTWFGMEPSLGFTPAQEAGIKAEFMAIAEDQFYAANGDPKLAMNRAEEQMKRLYGVTEMTGSKVVMRHPPERYWPAKTGFFTDPLGYAKEQLVADVTASLGEGAEGIDISRMQIIPTRETEAMIKRGEMPAYAILWTDENGVIQTMPGKLWRPDMSEAAIEAEAERQAVIDDAMELDADIKAGRDREQTLDNFLDGVQ